jgi:UDPglucose 6-dehydrogenase
MHTETAAAERQHSAALDPDLRGACRIAVIGTGYVGLVSGTCFASTGVRVTCVDTDATKIARLERGEVPIHEPGLDDLLRKAISRGTLAFTTRVERAVGNADAVFLAVGTPTDPKTGDADLTHVIAAAREIAPLLKPGALVVTKSTVPVGTNRMIAREIRAAAPEARFHTVSNPEFLREGQAVHDFTKPDRVVIGADYPSCHAFMGFLYAPFLDAERKRLFCTAIETAEMVKYAANAFLATKIAFINQVADFCEKAGDDVRAVARGIGLDPRISPDFLMAGPGYGGSCFPKDTLAFVRSGAALGAPQTIVEAVIAANAERKRGLADRVIRAAGGDAAGLRVGVLGLAFKAGTDDMRDAPALDLVPALVAAGASVRACDPAAQDVLPPSQGFERVETAFEAAEGADVLVLLTEWPDYADLPMADLLRRMRGNVLVDLRNLFDPDEMRRIGFAYAGIGIGSEAPAGQTAA